MKTLIVEPDYELEKNLLQLPAEVKHGPVKINSPTIIKNKMGDVLLVYGHLTGDYQELMKELKKIKYNFTSRITTAKTGVPKKYSERQFGYRLSRYAFRLNSAGACKFNQENAKTYSRLCKLGFDLQENYKKYSPDAFDRHLNISEKMHSEWKIPGTLFNQGIINDNAQLDYHYDKDNVENVMSCMAVFKQFCDGGALVVPALKCLFEFQNNSYLIFDGQKILHGVTKLQRAKNGWRRSVVFYSFAKFQNAGTFQEEILKFKKNLQKKIESKYENKKTIQK